jgi:hypothetical protein
MSLQILNLKLEDITAGDYLAWCQDPDPPALGFTLRSITIDADSLGDTITAILDWNQPPPPPAVAAPAAGLPLTTGAQIHALTPINPPSTNPTTPDGAGADPTLNLIAPAAKPDIDLVPA